MLAAFATTILYSFSAICGHRSAKLIGGAEANFWRVTFATFFLAAWAYSFGHGLNGSGFPMFLLSGILGIGIGDVAYFQALPRLGPRLSLLLVQCLTAPFGALIEWLWLGTMLTTWQIVFGLTILVGVAIALSPDERIRMTRRELVVGILCGLCAAMAGAAGAVLSRKAYGVIHDNHESIDPVNAGYQRVLGGLALSAISLLIAKRREFRIQAHAPKELIVRASIRKWRGVWVWILLNSLAGQTLGVSCLQWALENTPTGVVLPIVAMAPIVVIPMAYFFEHERPTAHSLLGGAVAVAGVIGLTLSR